MIAIAVFLAVVSVEALVIAYLIRLGVIRCGGRTGGQPIGWFDHDRFRAGHPAARDGVVDRVHASRGVVVHRCSYGGTPIEYPLLDDFDEDAVRATLAEIGTL